MSKSIFKATFEESLNLLDDGLADLQQEQHEKVEKGLLSKRGRKKLTLKNIFLTLLLPIGFNSLLVGFSWAVHAGGEEITLKASAFRLLTWSMNLWLFAIWFLIILIGKMIQQNYLIPYRLQFHWNNYLIILLIEINLLAIEIASTNISAFTFAILILGLIILSCILIYLAPVSIQKILYGNNLVENKRNKVARFISIYGTGILGLLLIIKYIFSIFSIGPSFDLTNVGMVVFWLATNLFGIWTIFYVGFPYFLRGYYKWKYSEEYREWEGKSLEEWYGERYLKKHPELLKERTD